MIHSMWQSWDLNPNISIPAPVHEAAAAHLQGLGNPAWKADPDGT